VTRRRRRQRARVPGRRAARRARDHERERLTGWYTPVPSRVLSILLVVASGRLPPGPNAGDAPRGRCAVWAYRRAPGVLISAEARVNRRVGRRMGLGFKPS
jgi:hypothetical protein